MTHSTAVCDPFSTALYDALSTELSVIHSLQRSTCMIYSTAVYDSFSTAV